MYPGSRDYGDSAPSSPVLAGMTTNLVHCHVISCHRNQPDDELATGIFANTHEQYLKEQTTVPAVG